MENKQFEQRGKEKCSCTRFVNWYQTYVDSYEVPNVNPGDVLVFSVLCPHAPLLNGGLGNRFVYYPYYGPMVLKADKGVESVLPNQPNEV